MKNIILITRIISLVLLLSIVLSSCGNGDNERFNDKSSSIFIGTVVQSAPSTYFPWASRDGIAPTIASLIYSTLLDYDELTGVYGPNLAESWHYVDLEGNPIVASGGQVDFERLEAVYGGEDTTYMTIKFVIDKDAMWSDGAKVTAEDIYYSFDLAANMALSEHAGALVWVTDLQHRYENGQLVQQGIFTYDRGANENGYYIAQEDREHVVYMRINKVLGAMTPLVSTLLIIPKHIIEPVISYENTLTSRTPTQEQNYVFSHPIGSGPYILLAEESNSQRIVLKRNGNYHIKKEDGSYLYNVEYLKFILFQDINVAIYALKKGHTDVLDSAIKVEYAKLFSDDEGIETLQNPGVYAQTLVLNVNPTDDQKNPMRNLLSDREFRRAIALAVNQTELVDRVLDGNGVTVSQGLISPDLTDLYNPDSTIITDNDEQNITEANAILDAIVPDKDKSGYRLLDGKKITYEILGTPGEQSLISYLEVQFQKIGISVKFKPKGSSPEKTYLYSSNFDMTLQGVVFNINNIDLMYNAHFVNMGTSSNYGRLRNEKITGLIAEMRKSINLNTKLALAKDIQREIAEEYYKIPLYCSHIVSVYRTDRFTGFRPVLGSSRGFNYSLLQELIQTE